MITAENVFHVVEVKVSKVDKMTIDYLTTYHESIIPTIIRIDMPEAEINDEVVPHVRNQILELQSLASLHDSHFVMFVD